MQEREWGRAFDGTGGDGEEPLWGQVGMGTHIRGDGGWGRTFVGTGGDGDEPLWDGGDEDKPLQGQWG